MTINDAVLYIILIWPIGFIFLYFLFGKLMDDTKKIDEVDEYHKW